MVWYMNGGEMYGECVEVGVKECAGSRVEDTRKVRFRYSQTRGPYNPFSFLSILWAG